LSLSSSCSLAGNDDGAVGGCIVDEGKKEVFLHTNAITPRTMAAVATPAKTITFIFLYLFLSSIVIRSRDHATRTHLTTWRTYSSKMTPGAKMFCRRLLCRWVAIRDSERSSFSNVGQGVTVEGAEFCNMVVILYCFDS